METVPCEIAEEIKAFHEDAETLNDQEAPAERLGWIKMRSSLRHMLKANPLNECQRQRQYQCQFHKTHPWEGAQRSQNKTSACLSFMILHLQQQLKSNEPNQTELFMASMLLTSCVKWRIISTEIECRDSQCVCRSIQSTHTCSHHHRNIN